jgi:hypothetical protein
METGPMLPFNHVCGYTLFPTAQCVGARWVGVIRVLEGTGAVRCQTTEQEFDTEYAAIVGATIDAASVANLIRAGF